MKVEYATLSYYPHTFNVEHINVGFFLHDIKSGCLYSQFVKKKNRWLEFDDRLNKDIIEDLIGFAKRTFDQTFGDASKDSIFGSNPLSSWSHKQGYFDFISRNFQNQMRLTPTLSADVDDPKSFFDDMCHLALYFDFDKDKRYKDKQIFQVLLCQARSILDETSSDYSLRAAYKRSDEDESIVFDYRIGDHYLKIINPNGTSTTSCIDRIKIWAYNSRYFEDKEKTILFVPLSDGNKDYYKYVKKILDQTNANVFYFTNELAAYLATLDTPRPNA